jgi:hypothetical protein
VPDESRNARVVALLILSMSMGVGVLFLLDGTLTWRAPAALTAQTGTRLDQVEIFFLPAQAAAGERDFDCLILPDGRKVGAPRPPHVRLAVQAAPEDRLTLAQQTALLDTLRMIGRWRYLTPDCVRLASDSDYRLNPHLPAAARELHSLLYGRGLVR